LQLNQFCTILQDMSLYEYWWNRIILHLETWEYLVLTICQWLNLENLWSQRYNFNMVVRWLVRQCRLDHISILPDDHKIGWPNSMTIRIDTKIKLLWDTFWVASQHEDQNNTFFHKWSLKIQNDIQMKKYTLKKIFYNNIDHVKCNNLII